MAESSEEMRARMETIEIVSLEPMGESAYLKPLRMKFKQNEKELFWDFLQTHDSVSSLIFNRTREVLVFVKQFRPVVFFNNACAESGPRREDMPEVKWSQIPATSGITLELCAGIMDKRSLTEQETAKEEVLEECGYDVPLDAFQFITKLRSGVGSSGASSSLFYVEVEDHMKVNRGGGNVDEGELIEVVEMNIPEITEYINQQYIQSPAELAFAVTWFLLNRKPQTLPTV